jgi:hypothetical protein
MPLPHVKKFCHATCKATGNNCRNPAAYGTPVCRYHGAKKPTSICRGVAHGRYKSGAFTKATKLDSRQAAVRLMELENMVFRLGMLRGNRTPGRKPGRA